MARSASWPVRAAFLVALLIVIASCTTPEIIRETPQPSPTSTTPLPAVETQVVPTATVSTTSPTLQIERIALATSVDDAGAPNDERSVIPEVSENFFLCILARNVEQGTHFQAIWFEGGDIIGRSDKVALEDSSKPAWIALFYRPIGRLNPAAEHAVELFVNDESTERLVFRVGIGNPEDAVAAAAFTTEFDELGKPVNPQTRFHVDTPQLTLRVRISSQVDPTGMIFSTIWYRGDTQIRQLAPNPPPGDNPTPDPRRLDFTFVPSGRMSQGNYRVALLLNGTEVRSIPFVLTTESIPETPPETPEEPAEAPAEEPAEAPAEQPAEEPAEQPAEQPAEEPEEAPAEEPAPETTP